MKLFSGKQIILLAITILIFAFLFRNIPAEELLQTVRQAQWPLLILAFFVMWTFPLLSALRWKMIIWHVGADLSLWESFKIIMAAWPIGSVTPAKSGDLIKLVFLKKVLAYSKTTGVILAERLMDVIALCGFSLVFGIQFEFYTASIFAVAMIVGVFGFIALMETPIIQWIPERLHPMVHGVLEATRHIFHNKRYFLVIFIVSLVNWFMSFFQTWLCYRAFETAVPLPYIMAALPIAIFIGLIPVTLSGMGTRDSAIILLFGKYAADEVNLAVGILYSIFGYWLLTFFGMFFLKTALSGSIGGVKGEELRKKIYQEPQE